MNEKKVRVADILIIGFALFSMAFGSGNVLFPPYLGVLSGAQWAVGTTIFVGLDLVIGLLAVYVMVRADGRVTSITGRIGHIPATILGLACIVCMGPLFCAPRSAAATYDMFCVPVLGMPSGAGNIVYIIFTIVFFAVVYLAIANESSVCDLIGKYLTPLLLIALFILVVMGIIRPAGEIAAEPQIDSVVKQGIISGYQSMDLIGFLPLGLVAIMTAETKGYVTKEKQRRVIGLSCIVALVLLSLSAYAFAYLGATVSKEFGTDANQATLVFEIGSRVLGNIGETVVSGLTGLACFTTAAGLSAGAAHYFHDTFGDKISYKRWCLIISIVACLVSNLGLTTILNMCVPVLSLVFPVIVVLVLLTLVGSRISDFTFRATAGITLVINLLVVLHDYAGLSVSFIEKLPFFEMGLAWLVPAIIVCALSLVVRPKKVGTTISKTETA